MRLQSILLSLALSSLITACLGSEAEYEEGLSDDGEVASQTPALESNAKAGSHRKLLHEVRHSETKVTRFWEFADDVIVETIGSIEKDGMPTEEEVHGKPLEILARFKKGTPPAALVEAVERSERVSREFVKARKERGAKALLDSAVSGPRPPEASAVQAVDQSRDFNAVSWWTTTACNFAGYPRCGSAALYAYKRCWDSPMSWVNSGVHYADHWQAMYSGWGTDATYKHWVLSCTQVFWGVTKCTWESETQTVKKGYYATWNASNLRERAGDLSTPNNTGSALYSLKADEF